MQSPHRKSKSKKSIRISLQLRQSLDSRQSSCRANLPISILDVNASKNRSQTPILHQNTENDDEITKINILNKRLIIRPHSTFEPSHFSSQQHMYQQIQSFKKRDTQIKFSKKNLQKIHKKLTEIRSSRYSTKLGIGENLEKSKSHAQIVQQNLFCRSLDQKQIFSRNIKNQQKGQQYQKKEKQKAQPQSSLIKKQFRTKLKKKTIQQSPHVLATIIRRKQQTIDREELYRFVNKIMERSKLNKK